jgi:hypothetical protein
VSKLYEMQGVGEDLVVYPEKLTITPRGVMGFMTKGLKGTKTIYFASVTGVQFREAGALLSGYLQFTIPGGNESKGGMFAAASDENTFMFAGKDNNGLARKILKHVEEQLGQKNAPAQTSSGGVADELAKLAELRAGGVLSDSEFERAKKKLLR